ncbi:MAG TPA: DnaB-like helicase N-terminal domain-containing protein, partial [Thermoleophilia bacterium]
MSAQLAELPTGRPARPALSHEAVTQGFDRVIEEAILGSLILVPKSIPTILEVLSADDFLLPSHQAIFAAIRDLQGEGEPVDPFTISDRLQGSAEFDAKDGRDYLLLLAALPTTAYDTLHQAHILKRQALERRARTLASEFLGGDLGLAELYEGCGRLLE